MGLDQAAQLLKLSSYGDCTISPSLDCLCPLHYLVVLTVKKAFLISSTAN